MLIKLEIYNYHDQSNIKIDWIFPYLSSQFRGTVPTIRTNSEAGLTSSKNIIHPGQINGSFKRSNSFTDNVHIIRAPGPMSAFDNVSEITLNEQETAFVEARENLSKTNTNFGSECSAV